MAEAAEKIGDGIRLSAVITSPLLEGVGQSVHHFGTQPSAIDFLATDAPISPSQTPDVTVWRRQLGHYFKYLSDPAKVQHAIHGSAFQRRLRGWPRLIAFGNHHRHSDLYISLNRTMCVLDCAAFRNKSLPTIVSRYRLIAVTRLAGSKMESTGGRVAVKHWLLNDGRSY